MKLFNHILNSIKGKLLRHTVGEALAKVHNDAALRMVRGIVLIAHRPNKDIPAVRVDGDLPLLPQELGEAAFGDAILLLDAGIDEGLLLHGEELRHLPLPVDAVEKVLGHVAFPVAGLGNAQDGLAADHAPEAGGSDGDVSLPHVDEVDVEDATGGALVGCEGIPLIGVGGLDVEFEREVGVVEEGGRATEPIAFDLDGCGVSNHGLGRRWCLVFFDLGFDGTCRGDLSWFGRGKLRWICRRRHRWAARRLFRRRGRLQQLGIRITTRQHPIGAKEPNIVVVLVDQQQPWLGLGAVEVDLNGLAPSPSKALGAPRHAIAAVAVQDQMRIGTGKGQVISALLGRPDDLVVAVEEEDADEVETEADLGPVVGIVRADVLVGTEDAVGREDRSEAFVGGVDGGVERSLLFLRLVAIKSIQVVHGDSVMVEDVAECFVLAMVNMRLGLGWK